MSWLALTVLEEDAQNCRIHEGTSKREKEGEGCSMGLSSTTVSTRHSTTTSLQAREIFERIASSALEDILLQTIHRTATDGTGFSLLLPSIMDTFKSFRVALVGLVSIGTRWCSSSRFFFNESDSEETLLSFLLSSPSTGPL